MKEARKTALMYAWRTHRATFLALSVGLVWYLTVMRPYGEYGRYDYGMWLLLVIYWPATSLFMIRSYLKELKELNDSTSRK